MIAGLLEAAGVDLRPRLLDAFTDDEGNVHEASINALAALDVIEGKTATTYAPSAGHVRPAGVAPGSGLRDGDGRSAAGR